MLVPEAHIHLRSSCIFEKRKGREKGERKRESDLTRIIMNTGHKLKAFVLTEPGILSVELSYVEHMQDAPSSSEGGNNMLWVPAR